MEAREEELGFISQKEIRYNDFLPYKQCLDKESNYQLAEIKTNLGLSIQNRDIKVAATHWTAQLSKYIRLYGHKFSKEDHIVFIKLLFELIVIPDLDYTSVSKFAQLLTSLLKKKELLTREDLTLPWRPLHKLLKNAVYSRYERHGLVFLPQNIETVLKTLVKCSRVYFSVESTQEMLDEWRPLMCLFDITMDEAMYFLAVFLPTKLTPEEHTRGYKLWFDEFFGLWDSIQNSPTWEKYLVYLFSRVAYDTVGQMDWSPYVPKIFTRLIRSFNLPVGSGKVHIARHTSNYDVGVVASLIVDMMDGTSNIVQEHLDKLWTALESFYHPSNYGRYSVKLQKFMPALSKMFVRRIHRERHEEDWQTPVPESHKLTDEQVTRFVKSIMPIVLVAMFSKLGPMESKKAFQQLAVLRPEIVIPPLLQRLYPALETLTEPHRLVACLVCLISVSRPMLVNTKWYPEGRTHVIPILNLCLPGIDSNDIKKTMTTFQIMSTLTSLVPIVDCSEAVHVRSDLTDIERELCSASAQFEDFVCQFLDKVFTLIENNAQDHIRSDSSGVTALASQELLIEMGLLSTFNNIVVMSSGPIYDEIVRRVFRFVSTNVYEFRVAGRFTGHLVRSVSKTYPEKALKIFMKHFCDSLISKCSDESIATLEHLDHEILWNLKLLAELVRCDGCALLKYIDELKQVLKLTLHVKCKDGADLAATLLNHTLRALTLVYVQDRGLVSQNRDDNNFPIRDWGKQSNLDNLEISWHVPSDAEKQAAKQILIDFLLPELERFKSHISGEKLGREELKQRLSIVHNGLVGASNVLPMWTGEPVQFVESKVKLTKFNNSASLNEEGISLDGKNFRVIVIETLRRLLDHMLGESDTKSPSAGEDDTKSLNLLTKMYSVLMFLNGCDRNELDTRWKAHHGIKKSMENKLFGKKAHLRTILVDRVQLQHYLRVINRSAKVTTKLHTDLFHDLFRLATSRYSEVRKLSQQLLGKGLHTLSFSYRALMDDVLHYLTNDEGIEHHQYKGALYVVLGESKRGFMSKRAWDVMNRMWPTLVNSKHSEKPSIIKLLDAIMRTLQKQIETTPVTCKVHDELFALAASMWTASSKPNPTLPQLTANEKQQGLKLETERNSDNARVYTELVENLVSACNSGKLNWKYHQIALQLLKLLTRCDISLPPSAVKLFAQNMVHDTLLVRKVAIAAMSSILKAEKRRHVTVTFNPYDVTKSTPPSCYSDFHPGDRADNVWHHYNSDELLDTREKYENTLLVEKTHWGYYCWPKTMKKYAPISEQPALGRMPEEMSALERVIYESFSDEQYVATLLKYLALEGQKGKDKFNVQSFTLFKGLFRDYDTAFLPIFRTHLEQLVSETSREKHEYSQRLATEIITGLIRGSKHWDFERVDNMWKWLRPLIRTGIANMSVESVKDWGTCFATSSESRDPRKLHYMFELLLEDPMRGDGGSFGDESRLYILQGALAQQEWRVPVLLNRLLEYLKPHLAHSYKNVRDRLGSFLVTLMMYDVQFPTFAGSNGPKHDPLIRELLPQLQILKETASNVIAKNGGQNLVTQMDQNDVVFKITAKGEKGSVVEIGRNVEVMEIGGTPEPMEVSSAVANHTDDGESEERKTAVRLVKTVLKYLQESFTRNLHTFTTEIFALLPVFCAVQSEGKDEEFKTSSVITMAFMAHSLLKPDNVQPLLKTVDEISEMRSWHARAAMLCYLQVSIFCNLFMMQEPSTKQHIEQLIVKLLCDEQLEVRQTASETLGGLFHCGYFSVTPALMSQFRKLASTRVKNKKHDSTPVSTEKIIKRHAGVLGLCACVQAYPYDVPEVVPQILMDLSGHLDDPQPIQMTVKSALSDFKRTHYDNWHDHKQKFTDDQLVVLTDLLVSPSYYA